MVSRVNDWAKRRRRVLVNRFGGKCCVCGSRSGLEFAHVRRTKLRGLGRGRKERLIDVSRHPESYRLTCKRHNSYVDYAGKWEKRGRK